MAMQECYTPQEADRLGMQADVDVVVEAAGLDAGADRETTAREAAGQVAAVRDQLQAELPASRELALALTRLDEAGMWLERVR